MGVVVKYLSGGNQTATVISLCLLRDMDPSTEVVQFALRDGTSAPNSLPPLCQVSCSCNLIIALFLLQVTALMSS